MISFTKLNEKQATIVKKLLKWWVASVSPPTGRAIVKTAYFDLPALVYGHFPKYGNALGKGDFFVYI